jgi:hypothetical protein
MTIVTADMKGLGRGRGFKSTNKQSVDLSSPVVRKIYDRLLNIISMMLSEGVVSQEDIVEKLQLNEYVSNDDYKSLLDKLDDAYEKLKQAQNKIKSYNCRFDKMSSVIAEAIGDENIEDWDLDPEDLEFEANKSIAVLEFGVNRIIDEVLALKDN